MPDSRVDLCYNCKGELPQDHESWFCCDWCKEEYWKDNPAYNKSLKSEAFTEKLNRLKANIKARKEAEHQELLSGFGKPL